MRIKNLFLVFFAVAILAPSVLEAKTASRWRHGVLEYYDTDTGKATILPLADYSFCDDFLYTIFDDSADAPWETVETSLNASIDISADASGGALSLALDADNNAERAVIYFGDNEVFTIYSGCILEARVQWSVLGTGNTTTVIGLAGHDNAVEDTVDTSAWFRIHHGDSDALLWETDDGTTDDDDNTGQAIAVTTWYVLRIDAWDEAAVKFYVNGTLIGTGAMAALDATTGKVQPYIAIQKGAGTGVGTLLVDYVRCWGWR